MATHRHRSHRANRLRKNIVGFSLPPPDSSDSDPDGELHNASLSITASMSISDDDLFGQMDRMVREVDGFVRFVRRGMEELAENATELASAFGILSFNLEDWDR
jgi:gamma-tubulin complex component 5